MCCFSVLFDRIFVLFFVYYFFSFILIFSIHIYVFFGERAQNQICIFNGE